ncbi:PH domain containing protein [Acanthamoeba castellanii str. Neff]|uniref:PH domain containing protein n=1 Tax=Acanthamoeba castellanii (strain ATCC 30010 / Neff) TaxID=1257118 RepID=L8GNR8_ACACF|nr:PH domain containing protein [Acanthamoeba castellanii str. Neff]ELR14569.1 PH domain containing protein [Acanthamoeba castellanii str. Neff]
MSLREGYLTKQGGKVKTWKRRWFSLDSDYVLHYYTNVGAELKGEFSLKTAGEIREIPHKKKFPYLFEVETPNRTYRMAADNEESMEKWLVALKRARDGTDSMEEAEAKLKKAEAERQRARAAAEAEAERLRKEAEADAAVWSLQPSSWTLEPTTFPAKRDALVENVYPRLLHIQGAKQPHISITHVCTSSDSINDSDVFVLDNNKTVYTWMGSGANIWQQTAAATLTRALDDERGSDVLNLVLSDPMGSDAKEFWRLLGGMPLRLSTAAPQPYTPAIFRLTDASGEMEFHQVASGNNMSRRVLDPNDVFIVDLGFHVFVWVGQQASRGERDLALGYAQGYMRAYDRPDYLHVDRVMDGGENELLYCFLTN